VIYYNLIDAAGALSQAENAESCVAWFAWGDRREMTAADLGLPIQYDGKWTDFTFDQDFIWWGHVHRPKPDAPYSFWLGASA
jgi:hypothetical protein